MPIRPITHIQNITLGGPGDVARADAAGDGEHQRLERAEMPGLVVERLAQDAEHGAEVAELHEARGDREHQPGGDQPVDQDVAPQEVVQKIQHGLPLFWRPAVMSEAGAGRRRVSTG
jgi:hypothetical protein